MIIEKLFEGTKDEVDNDLIEKIKKSSIRKIVIYAETSGYDLKENASTNHQYPPFVMDEEGKVPLWHEETGRYTFHFPEDLPENHIEHPSNREWLQAKLEKAIKQAENGELYTAEEVRERLKERFKCFRQEHNQ